MAKGGRYLDTSKNSKKKKGKGGKIALAVLLVFVLVIGGVGLFVASTVGDMLGSVKRPELIEQNQDKSYEDLINEMNAELYDSEVVLPQNPDEVAAPLFPEDEGTEPSAVETQDTSASAQTE